MAELFNLDLTGAAGQIPNTSKPTPLSNNIHLNGSGQAQNTSDANNGHAAIFHSASVGTARQYSKITIGASLKAGADAPNIGPAIRVSNTGTLGVYTRATSLLVLEITWGGAEDIRANITGLTIGVGTTVEIRDAASGNEAEIYVDDVLVGTTSGVSTITQGTGQIGLAAWNRYNLFEDWSGGTVEAGVTITDANTDEIIGQAESTVLTGTNFEAVKGTGTVKISPTDNIADASAVTQTVTAWADTSITFTADFSGTGIAEGGTGYIFVTNDSGQSNANGFQITRQDLTAPTLTGPAGTATGPTTADLVVSTNEAGGTLYWYVSTSATPPSDTDLKAGTGAVYAFNESVGATGVQSDSATGLSAATQYFLHALQTDGAGLDSAIATSAGFTTDALPTIDTSAAFDEGLKTVGDGQLLADESNIRVDVWRNDTGALVLFNQTIAAISSGHLSFEHASLPAVSLHIKAYPTGVLPVAWDQTPA